MNSNEVSNKEWTKEDIISYIESSETIEDAHSIIWDITEKLTDVNTFISALKEIMYSDNKADVNSNLDIIPKRNKIAKKTGSLDFIFDHYFPMIEATNIDFKDEKLILSRINIIRLLCSILINFPYNINPFYNYHKAMWNILLKIMKKCDHCINYSSKSNITQSHPLILEAFRSIINLYENTRKRISQKTQAARLLSLICNNLHDPFLNSLSVRYVMKIRPPEFGFVTLCKQLIGNGITNPQDLGLIHDILNLPNVRDPTDIYKYLFTIAVSHKTLSNSAMHIVENTFSKFSHLADFKTWCTLFTKRCFEFILFSLHKKGKKTYKNDQPKTKYCRRIYLIRRFYDKLYNLKIDWLSSTIQKSAYTVISLDEDSSSFLSNHYELTSNESDEGGSSLNIEMDEKIKEDVMSTNVELIDLKAMLNDIKISLPIIHSSSKTDINNESSTGRKPTISEARSIFLRSKSKLQKRKLTKRNANQINDNIPIIIKCNGHISSLQENTVNNTIDSSDKAKNEDQEQLKLNENQNENCLTEMI